MGIRLSPNNPKNNSWRDDYPMTYLTSFSDDRTKARKEQMNEISSMTDEQLNEALAIEVMGLGLDLIENEWGLRYYRGADGKSVMDARLWQPCTDLNQAVECAEKLADENWYPMIYGTRVSDDDKTPVYCAIMREFADGDSMIHRTKEVKSTMTKIYSNPARALSEAVLMAVRGEG